MNRSPLSRVRLSGRAGLLALVCAAALGLRMEGVCWPRYHPDERTIGEWIQRGQPPRVYAGGFFTLVRPVRWVWEITTRAAQAVRYRQGARESPYAGPSDLDPILLARWFNVWLGTLTTLFIYLLARRVTGSTGAGLLGAALFAFSQYAVEHCHYGETDTAMVFALTVSLWLWVEAVARRRPGWFAATALAAGFAAGTKFTLLTLLPPLLLAALAQHARPGGPGTARRLLGYGLGAAALFAIGFALATPRVLDWPEFAAGLAFERQRLLDEMLHTEGRLGLVPGVRYVARLRDLAAYARSLGWVWLGLAVLGAPCLLRGGRRPYAIPALLVPLTYTAYWVFRSPYVRSQEFLNFVPAACVLAALAAHTAWTAGGRFARAAAPAVAVLALAGTAGRAATVASVFGWRDTRQIAEEWLRRHEPPGAVFAKERYASPVLLTSSFPIRQAERDGLAGLRARGADYLLRHAGASGRGSRDPRTGEPYPHYQQAWADIRSESERLCSWHLLPPEDTLTAFNSIALDLYGLRRFNEACRLDLTLPQPAYGAERGRHSFFAVGGRLGSATAVPVDRYAQDVAVGGPWDERAPVYAVLNTAERPAEVILRGFGRRATARLGLYDAAVVPLRRPAWHPRLGHVERLRVTARPEPNVIYIPCYLRMAFSPADVLRLLVDLGRVDRAPAALLEAAAAADPLLGYEAAVAARDWPRAGRLESGAVAQAETLRRAVARPDPAAVRIGELSGHYYDAFARVHLDRDAADAVTVLVNTRRPADEATPPAFEAAMSWPIRLAGGACTAHGDFLVRTVPTAGPVPPLEIVWAGDSRPLAVYTQEMARAHQYTPLAFPVAAGRETPLEFRLRCAAPVVVHCRGRDVRWDLAAMLRARLAGWGLAAAEHRLASGRPEAALEALASLPGPLPDPGGRVRAAQARFGALRALDTTGASARLLDSARTLLDLAPRHQAALEVLASSNPECAALAREQSGRELAAPLALPPFLELRGFAYDPAARRVRCVFEALRNETPPLAVALYSRRWREWVRKKSVPLSDRAALSRGERFVIETELGPEFRRAEDPSAVALGVEASVRGARGTLPIGPQGRPRMTFREILGR